jgi:hypothetical protein
MEVWARALAALAAEDQDVETVVIDTTHLKAHRTAAGLRGQKGTPAAGEDASSAAPRAG